jgi:hypothetical protein
MTPQAATAEKTKVKIQRLTEDDADRYEDESEDDGWDGTLFETKLSRPIMRNQQIVTPKMTETKPLYFKAARIKERWADEDGKVHTYRWVGPEAAHLMDLIAVGVIANTPESNARSRRQAVIDHERGVDGNEDHGPLPHLTEATPVAVKRRWEKPLAGGSKEAMRKELQESREGIAELRRYAGAEAPGSARAKYLNSPEPAPEAGAEGTPEGDSGSKE